MNDSSNTSEPPTLDEVMADFDPATARATEGNPFADADPVAVAANYAAIMVKHLRLTLRDDADRTIAEGGDFANMNVSSLIGQIRAMGYDVDEPWLIQSLAKNLPHRN